MKFDEKIKLVMESTKSVITEQKVVVNVNQWKLANKMKKPNGKGDWRFQIGDAENSFGNLPFTKAKLAAMDVAKEQGIKVITLLP